MRGKIVCQVYVNALRQHATLALESSARAPCLAYTTYTAPSPPPPAPSSLVPISTMSGEEFNQGELQRYLAELAWCPFALFQHKTLEFAPVEGYVTMGVRSSLFQSAALFLPMYSCS